MRRVLNPRATNPPPAKADTSTKEVPAPGSSPGFLSRGRPEGEAVVGMGDIVGVEVGITGTFVGGRLSVGIVEVGIGEAVAPPGDDGGWGVSRGVRVGSGVIRVEGVTGGGEVVEEGVGMGDLVFL